MKKISIDSLSDEIMKGLEEYKEISTEEIKKVAKKTASNVRKRIGESAPVGATGKYSKSWSVKKEKETSDGIELIVHSKNRYQLAHLLEKGHAKRGGGRVQGRPHIALAEEEGVREFEREIERILKNG